MNSLDQKVYDLMGLGSKQAKNSKWFNQAIGISRRDLCQSVYNLRNLGIPIGADRSRGGGYYIMVEEEDKRRTIAQMKSQAYEMLKTAGRMEDSLIDGCEQLELGS